jgi:hypothetical protein
VDADIKAQIGNMSIPMSAIFSSAVIGFELFDALEPTLDRILVSQMPYLHFCIIEST